MTCAEQLHAAEPADADAMLAELRALFAGNGSRAPGMPGNKALAAHVERVFRESGFETGTIRFNGLAFEPGKTTLNPSGGAPIELEVMHPSLLRPGNFAEDEFDARVLYLGKGSYDDLARLRGTSLAGAIALMDYDCGERWLDLLRFGVKGFVFAGVEHYDHRDSYTKIYNTEVAVPRFFVPPDQGAALKAACAGTNGLAAAIESEPSRWRREEMHNYWVLVPGADEKLKQQVVVFTAPIDANAVVPARAIGAQSAINLYLLLKMLEDFRERPPARSVMLVAVNAHTHRYQGERMLAWYLLARSGDVERVRDDVAKNMRVARLYSENYQKLKFLPVELDRNRLHVGMELLWALDNKQQALRLAEYEKTDKERRAKIKRLKRQKVDTRELEATPTPEPDPVLDLSVFGEQDYRAAIESAVSKAQEERSGLLARISSDEETLAEMDKDLARLRSLRELSFAHLLELAEQVKPIFDDEKLFETWRVKLDASTGVRLPIKGPLQDEIKRSLTKVKLDQMALSKDTTIEGEERAKLKADLAARRDSLTKVLVLFNKIDVGIGQSRTYYRQLAINDTQRELLKQRRDTLLAKYAEFDRINREVLELDTSNDSVREVLGTRRVALVINLEMLSRSDKIGFCSRNRYIGGSWQRGFGRVSTEIGLAVTPPEQTNDYPLVDSMTGWGAHDQEHYFHSVQSAAEYFQAAEATHAFAIKSAFSNLGPVFSPVDTFEHVNGAHVFRLQWWLRRFWPALLANEDITLRENLKPIYFRGKHRLWCTMIRTFAMDEFAGKPTPDQEIPNCLTALYEVGRPPHVLPFLLDGDVVNCYDGITGETGQTLIYALDHVDKIAPSAYQMDADFRRVNYVIDKGRIQTSKQISSNIRRSWSKTFPMFPCWELPIYDRIDPSIVSSRPITVNAYWPKTAKGQSDPQKYGLHGVGSLSPAYYHVSKGPAAVYVWQKNEKFAQEALLLLTDGKRCLLNATEQEPEGAGFLSAEEVGPDVFARIAPDMDTMNRSRLSEMKGVANQLIDEFLSQGRTAIEETEAAQASNDHNAYVLANYKAVGNEAKAYGQIRDMNEDMLKSIVVYMALMVPFCFFLSKLLFNFSRLEHELGGFVALFVGMYTVFRLIHPAFAIAMSPEAIFIAFVLGAIGCFITSVLHNRFQDEMTILFRKGLGMGEEVAYGTVGEKAMLIGVQNMKRRRVRTTLTTGTIVLVIFTMLAFSSVSKKISPTVIRKSFDAPYTGLFYHWPGAQPMDEETCRVLRRIFVDRSDVVTRRVMKPRRERWLLQRLDLDRTKAEHHNLNAELQALMGLPLNDHVFLEALPLVCGRYFSAEDAREIILPSNAAEAMEILPEQVGKLKLRLLGEEFLLVGLVDDQRYSLIRDLNPNLPLLPFKKRAGAPPGEDAESLEIDPEEDIGALCVDTASVAILPAGLAKALGAAPFSVSVRFPEKEDRTDESFALWDEVTLLLNISLAKFYIGSTDPFRAGDSASQRTQAGVYYVGSSYKTSIGGLSRLFIPLIIAGSIILNTMLGTVYERKSEIAIFNAIGLNPTHIFMFFLSEAFVYSFIGSVGGYLIGQVLAVGIRAWDLVKGVNINFSSLMVVYAILFTIGLVLLSTIYPGIVATRAAVPSGKRKWAMPEHDGRVMTVVFPFIYQPHLAPGVMYYLYEYFTGFSEQSLGDLIVTYLDKNMGRDEEQRPTYMMRYSVALAPFDLGVTQEVRFDTHYDEIVKSYRLHMTVTRVSGQDTDWATTNKPFLERMRKFLIRWRNIDPTQTKYYVQCGRRLFKDKPLGKLKDKTSIIALEMEEAEEEAKTAIVEIEL